MGPNSVYELVSQGHKVLVEKSAGEGIECHDEHYEAAGAEIIKPLTTETWGMREFGLRTVDGHRIMIGQDLKGE